MYGNLCAQESPREHQFTFNHLKNKCIQNPKKEGKLFCHFTGFNSCEEFMSVLSFVLPGLDRTRFVYWNTKRARELYIDTEKLLNESDMEPVDDEKENSQDSDLA